MERLETAEVLILMVDPIILENTTFPIKEDTVMLLAMIVLP